jgi:hypothetical protein
MSDGKSSSALRAEALRREAARQWPDGDAEFLEEYAASSERMADIWDYGVMRDTDGVADDLRTRARRLRRCAKLIREAGHG